MHKISCLSNRKKRKKERPLLIMLKRERIDDGILSYVVVVVVSLIQVLFFRNLRDDVNPTPFTLFAPLDLYNEVLRCNPEAFGCSIPGNTSVYLEVFMMGLTA